MNKVIIFGLGKISDVAYYYLKNDTAYDIAAFTADSEYVKTDTRHGLPVISFENIENKFSPHEYKMFIAVGYHDMNKARYGIFCRAEKKGYDLVSYISSKAIISEDVNIGKNCFICENNSIQAGCEIGDNVVMWPNNAISHHSKIRHSCWVTSGVTISGSVVVDPFCFIGINSYLGHEINVGQETFMGAGSGITKDASPRSVFIKGDTPKFKLDSEKFIKFARM